MTRSTPSPFAIVGIASLALAASACKTPQRDAGDPGATSPASSATTQSAELAPQPAPPPTRSGLIEQVAIPGDRPALLVRGKGSLPIVHLHGMCTDARSDLEAWAAPVSEHGTILALAGDADCKGAPGESRTWSMDVAAIDRRIDAALDAARRSGVGGLDPREVLVIGESMGASRATALARTFPAKYSRVVLVGAPETPSPNDLHEAKAVALVAAEKEPQDKMRGGTTRLANAGIAARFWELPEANHGEYGSHGGQLMSEAVAYVSTH